MTTLSVRVNGKEFSRYFDMNLIKATISTSAANSTVATFTLIREDGYGIVATKTGTVQSGAATATVDLRADCFDTDGVFRAKTGKYHVRVALPDLTVADSSTFDVTMAPVKILKEKYLRGVDLLAADILAPQGAFISLTGVKVVNASTTQFKGIFPLVWNGTNKTLSWDSGTAVTIDTTQSFVHAVLINSRSSAYIEVDVSTPDLPAGTVTENVILDFAEIEDDTIRSFIQDAIQDVQGRLYLDLEPTVHDTERPGDTSYANEFTDEYADPLSYYRDSRFPLDQFLSVRFPHPWIFQHGFKRLEFFFNSSKVASIDKDQWLVNMTKANSGLVEFVPKVSATLIFSWFSTAGLAFMTRWSTIPSAWHYRLTSGLPDLEKDGRGRVLTAVFMTAAIRALTLAGLAAAPGLTSESTGRDGVSQSKAYAQGIGGRYSLIIQQHQTFLYGPNGNSGEILKLRQRLLGVYGVTL